MLSKVEAQKAFLEWLRQQSPVLFDMAKEKALSDIGLGAIDIGSIFSQVIDAAKTYAPDIIKYREQIKLFDANLKRSQEGLPPLTNQTQNAGGVYQTGMYPSQQGQVMGLSPMGWIVGLVAVGGLLYIVTAQQNRRR